MAETQTPQDQPRFESLLARLEDLVRALEAEELDLEQSLQAFEEGVGLARECHRRLDAAERKIEVLRQETDGGGAPQGGGDRDAGEGS